MSVLDHHQQVTDLLREADIRSPRTYRDARGRVRAGVLSRGVLDALAVAPRRLTELALELDRSKHVIDNTLARLARVGRVRRGLYALVA